ncbi:MAG: BTAD domain-containing putative transcriptional regulator [Actinomycetota bacterium]|nr:BTAD domain-containing putative transcriptional regulator [Actinomycetota bacterium]
MVLVRVLGPVEAESDAGPVRFGSPIHRRIVAVLAAAHPGVVRRERLVDAVWGDEPPRTAASSLAAHLSRIRTALDGAVVSEAGGDRLAATLDTERFEELLAPIGPDGAAPASEALARIDEALALWRGDAFGDTAEHPMVIGAARRLEALRLGAELDRAALLLADDDPDRAAAALEPIVADHPLTERAWVLYVRALSAANRTADALRGAQEGRRHLAAVGLDASPELRAAEEDALGFGGSAAPGSGAVERLEEQEVAPAAVALVGRRLPRRFSSFVGRDRELAALAALGPDAALVTLSGPGGVGKTRLAIEATARFDEPGDGTWFCDLAAAVSADDVAVALADAVGAPVTAPIAEHLVEFCSRRSMRIVLDNCEQVTAPVADLVERVLHRAPGVRFLATSRVRLGVDGEQVVEVAPLDAASAGAELFLDRARAAGVSSADPSSMSLAGGTVRGVVVGDRAPDHHADRDANDTDAPDHVGEEHVAGDRDDAASSSAAGDGPPSDVVELCRRLDGLPLAIEMAASLMPSMTPGDILERLDRRLDLLGDDRRDARHRTLRSVVESSHGLLSAAEQQVFRRLAVFRSAFRLDRAEAVTGWGSVDGRDVARHIAALRDRSLLVSGDGPDGRRLRLLETVRDHAAEQLADAGEDRRTADRHARVYAAVAEEIEDRFRGPDETAAIALLDAELADLRAAHRHALAVGALDEAVRIPAALFAVVYERLRSDIGDWAAAALDLAGVDDHPRTPTLVATAAIARFQAERLDDARRLAERGVELAGDGPARCEPLLVLANLAMVRGDLDQCRASATDAHDAASSGGDPFTVVVASVLRSLAIGYGGDLDTALVLAKEVRERAMASGAPTLEVYAAYLEGELLAERDPATALARLDEAVREARRCGGGLGLGISLLTASTVRAHHGAPDRAAVDAFREAMAHWRERGAWVRQWITVRNFAAFLARTGAHHDAAVLLGAAAAHGDAYGTEATRLGRIEARLVDDLGEEAYEEARSDGRRRDPAALIEWAMTLDPTRP